MKAIWMRLLLALAACSIFVVCLTAATRMEARVSASRQQLMEYSSALSAWSSRTIPAPPAAAADRGWHGYAQVLSGLAASVPRTPKPYRLPPVVAAVGPWHAYASLASSRIFASNLGAAGRSGDKIRSLLGREAAVVTAADTVMDYPAATDLSVADPAQLTPRVQAAIGGLERAAGTLRPLQTPDDPGITYTYVKLTSVIAAYKALLAAVGTASQAGAETGAVNVTAVAQADIHANRTAYTIALNAQMHGLAEGAARDIGPIVSRLTN